MKAERWGTGPGRRLAERRGLAWRAAAAAAVVLVLSASSAHATDDPYFDRQWGLRQIGAPAAWAKSTGAGVKIGIVDTGVDAAHPDLAGKIDAMANCVGGPCKEGSARDGEGHGTAVAAIAAAKTGNAVGIAGVAPDAHLIVAKALDDDGSGTTEDINNAIRWVVDRGARIVNLSLGDPNLVLVSRLGTPLKPAIEYAWSRGAIPVLASGNFADDITQPGSANHGSLDAVVVGATETSGKVSAYSSPLGNAKWGVVAPGGSGRGQAADIVSAVPGGRYASLAGTSFAAPHVSGVLALLLAEGLDAPTAVALLLETAEGKGSCGDGCKGRVRADLAVARAVRPATTAVPVLTPTSAPTSTGSASGSGREDELSVAVVGAAAGLLVATAAGTVVAALRGRRSGRGAGTHAVEGWLPGSPPFQRLA